MKDVTSARLEYIDKAAEGAYTPKQAKAKLDGMAQEFGKLAFLPGTVTRKPRPWSETDLKELWLESAAGAGSREYLEYLAEMGWEVKQAERRQQRIKFFGILAAVVAAAAIIFAVLKFKKK